ncbi:trypsin-like serine protease [Pseudomonas sp. LB3P14]
MDNRDSTPLLSTSAYVLTAGHCIDHSNGKIITNKRVTGSMTFNYFTDVSKNTSYPVKQVKWRSMQGVDMAIVELNVSMHTLKKQGIRPLKLARFMPPDGSNVLIVGAPQYSTLQMSACTL